MWRIPVENVWINIVICLSTGRPVSRCRLYFPSYSPSVEFDVFPQPRPATSIGDGPQRTTRRNGGTRPPVKLTDRPSGTLTSPPEQPCLEGSHSERAARTVRGDPESAPDMISGWPLPLLWVFRWLCLQWMDVTAADCIRLTIIKVTLIKTRTSKVRCTVRRATIIVICHRCVVSEVRTN